MGSLEEGRISPADCPALQSKPFVCATLLAESGGIRPPPRIRSSTALTLAEREEISRSIVAGDSMRTIARNLERAPSTISREIKRNGGIEAYRAAEADAATWNRAHRPKASKLLMNQQLANAVAAKLRQRWSPQQVAGWLKHSHPGNEELHVSHETIYKTLFIQTRGARKRTSRCQFRNNHSFNICPVFGSRE